MILSTSLSSILCLGVAAPRPHQPPGSGMSRTGRCRISILRRAPFAVADVSSSSHLDFVDKCATNFSKSRRAATSKTSSPWHKPRSSGPPSNAELVLLIWIISLSRGRYVSCNTSLSGLRASCDGEVAVATRPSGLNLIRLCSSCFVAVVLKMCATC